MVGASKILTVSYGTFSCTLEGFDEPFTTMKAIAEYFRDLAAEDRYFGAEPPQPDAEMLHRIAEREIHRRVEAKIQRNGVILRPQEIEAEAPAAPVAEAPAPVAEAAPAPAPAAAPADGVSESVAAKLQRIRAAVATARAAASAQPQVFAEDTDIPAPAAEFAGEPEEVVGAAPAEEFGYDLDISGPIDAEVEEQAAEEPAVEAVAEPEPEAIAAPIEEPVAEEIAPAFIAEEVAPIAEAEVFVEGIAPVEEPVAQFEETAEVAPEESESEALLAEEPSLENILTEDLASVEDTVLPETTEEALPVAEIEEPAPQRPRGRVLKVRRAGSISVVEAAAIEETLAIEPEAEAPVAGEPVAEAEDLVAAADADEAEWISRIAEEPVADAVSTASLTAEQEAELLAELAALEDDRAEEPAETMQDAEIADDLDIEAFVAAQAEAEQVEMPMTEDFVEALSPETQEALSDALETYEDEAQAEPVEAAMEAEDAAEDAAEAVAAPEFADDDLAELLAEEERAASAEAVDHGESIAAGLADAEINEDVLAHEEPAAPHEAEAAAPVAEDDFSRLLEKADAQLSGTESRRRLSAIAHLKAAVAATVADRKVSGKPQDEDTTQPYREDLITQTNPVRPRRPVTGAAVTPRPTAIESRPAPLVLVSEQRIDRSADEAQAAAIRPRRVSATHIRPVESTIEPVELDEIGDGSPDLTEAGEGFAAFAESLGSQGLSDLLEAAAAYTAQVEGRPHFSPPQIMRKLSAVSPEGGFSREDRLRVFGTLLRQGKIAKVKRGQYAITENSQYFEKRA